MKPATARVVANAVLGLSAVAAAYFISANPRLRRVAWRLAKVAATTMLPAYLSREVQQAWVETGRGREPVPGSPRAPVSPPL